MRLLEPGDAVDDLLAPYESVDRTLPPGRPWVLANMVAGLDGTAAFGGRVGPLSHGADVELFRLLRAVADVVLVGATTFRREGYGPVRLPAERREARQAAGRAAVPTLAVVSGSLALDWSSPAFDADGGGAIVVTGDRPDAAALRGAGEAVEVLQAGSERVDLAATLDVLFARGHGVVLCEGGPTLLGELVELDLLDELCLTVAPVMGGDELPVAITRQGVDVRSFALRHVATDGGSLFLRYERERS